MYYPHLKRSVPSTPVTRLDGCGAADGLVCTFMENNDVIAVWPVASGSSVQVLCSCGNVLGKGRAAYSLTHVDQAELRELNSQATPCRHARALSQALDRQAYVFGPLGALPALSLRLHRGLRRDNQQPPGPLEYILAELGGLRDKRRDTPVYFVFYSEVWKPVIIKPSKNPHKLACCFSSGCLTQPYGCIHAKRVNSEREIEAAESSAAVAAFIEDSQIGVDGIYMGSDDSDDGGPPGASQGTPLPQPWAVASSQGSAPSAAGARRALGTLQPRRSRNMLPCSEEVRLCREYDAAVDAARSQDIHCVLPEFFCRRAVH